LVASWAHVSIGHVTLGLASSKMPPGPVAEAGVIIRIGDDVEEMRNIKVLFIAGFGPIVREASASRKLYNQILGIGFKEENDGYLHTESLKGAKTFAL
jgi:hypothetical protein